LEARDLPAPLTWIGGVNLPNARAAADAISVQGSNLFVLGGTTTGGGSQTVLSLSPSGTATSWVSHAGDFGMPDDSRTNPGVGNLPNGHILVFGGSSGGAVSSAVDYDLGAGNPVTKHAMSTARQQLAYATDTNHPYAIGGRNGSGTVLASVERYDYASNTWTTLAPLPQGHYAFTAVSDGNGHIYTFGGGTTSAASSVSADVYQYTVATDTWTAVASMPLATRESTAVLGPNGKIYVLGGSDGTTTLATVQVYDIASNTWTTDTDLPVAVRDAAGAIDSVGRLDVIGGYGAGGTPIASVYKTQRLNIADAAPVITSQAAITASLGGTYTYQVVATGNPDPTFALVTAPDGMTINSQTGRITWMPTLDQFGSQAAVTVQVTNALGQATQSFNITVRDTTPPTVPTNVQVANITPTSVTLTWNPSTDNVAVAGYKVYTAVFVHDPRGSGGAWFYSLVATVTDTTATVTSLAPNHSYTLTVAAFDISNNLSGYSSPYLGITTPSAPIWGYTFGSTSVVANHPISLQPSAAGNPPAITYSVVSGPAGLTIDPNTGRVSWTPTPDQVGPNAVTFEATNAIGSTDLNLTLTVTPDVPVLSWSWASGSGPNAVAGSPVAIQVNDSSLTPSTFSLVSAPATMTIDPNTGLINWTPTLSDAGNTTVHVKPRTPRAARTSRSVFTPT
jgi:N-acetylneuraminic acid mutarotase